MAPPGEPNAGVGVFNTAGFGWTTSSLVQGGYGFVTIIHELRHGMGLAHPHDNGGTSTIFPGISGAYDTGAYNLNQGVYTTMSYIDGWHLDPECLRRAVDAHGDELALVLACSTFGVAPSRGQTRAWETETVAELPRHEVAVRIRRDVNVLLAAAGEPRIPV